MSIQHFRRLPVNRKCASVQAFSFGSAVFPLLAAGAEPWTAFAEGDSLNREFLIETNETPYQQGFRSWAEYF